MPPTKYRLSVNVPETTTVERMQMGREIGKAAEYLAVLLQKTGREEGADWLPSWLEPKRRELALAKTIPRCVSEHNDYLSTVAV